jgi:exopolyphosphatase/guanosine-5'-triphosphate,3'-diphosphate pyrophosphatase
MTSTYGFLKSPLTPLTLMSIDLGSNALRASIARVEKNNLTVLYNQRLPLRLGEEVFTHGFISPHKKQKTIEAFLSLFYLCIEYGVTEVSAVATSAMREAKNSGEIIDEINFLTGIQIELISGQREAKLLFKACSNVIDFKNKPAILIDIGGGSTEITLVEHNQRKASRSFPVGTVRLLKHTNRDFLLNRIRTEVKEMEKFIENYLSIKKINLFVGTGGNLRRIGKMRKKILHKPETECSYEEVSHMTQTLHAMTYIERIRKLELDQDRADVIVPATMIIERLMKNLNLKKIQLPKVGLKEGLFLEMLNEENVIFHGLD